MNQCKQCGGQIKRNKTESMPHYMKKELCSWMCIRAYQFNRGDKLMWGWRDYKS